jgi:hypothetical protein
VGRTESPVSSEQGLQLADAIASCANAELADRLLITGIDDHGDDMQESVVRCCCPCLVLQTWAATCKTADQANSDLPPEKWTPGYAVLRSACSGVMYPMAEWIRCRL